MPSVPAFALVIGVIVILNGVAIADEEGAPLYSAGFGRLGLGNVIGAASAQHAHLGADAASKKALANAASKNAYATAANAKHGALQNAAKASAARKANKAVASSEVRVNLDCGKVACGNREAVKNSVVNYKRKKHLNVFKKKLSDVISNSHLSNAHAKQAATSHHAKHHGVHAKKHLAQAAARRHHKAHAGAARRRAAYHAAHKHAAHAAAKKKAASAAHRRHAAAGVARGYVW